MPSLSTICAHLHCAAFYVHHLPDERGMCYPLLALPSSIGMYTCIFVTWAASNACSVRLILNAWQMLWYLWCLDCLSHACHPSPLICLQIVSVREKIMGCTDARVKAISEALTGIKAIKLYAWEGPWSERISGLRDEELGLIKRAALLSISGSLLWLAVRSYSLSQITTCLSQCLGLCCRTHPLLIRHFVRPLLANVPVQLQITSMYHQEYLLTNLIGHIL